MVWYTQIHAWHECAPLLEPVYPYDLMLISSNFYSLSWTLKHCLGTSYSVWIYSCSDEWTRSVLCHPSCFRLSSVLCSFLASSCVSCLCVETWSRPCLRQWRMLSTIIREVEGFDLFGSLAIAHASWLVCLVSCSSWCWHSTVRCQRACGSHCRCAFMGLKWCCAWTLTSVTCLRSCCVLSKSSHQLFLWSGRPVLKSLVREQSRTDWSSRCRWQHSCCSEPTCWRHVWTQANWRFVQLSHFLISFSLDWILVSSCSWGRI